MVLRVQTNSTAAKGTLVRTSSIFIPYLRSALTQATVEGQNGRFLEAKAYPVEIDNVDSVRILYSTKEDVVSVPIKATIISSSSSFPVVAIAWSVVAALFIIAALVVLCLWRKRVAKICKRNKDSDEDQQSEFDGVAQIPIPSGHVQGKFGGVSILQRVSIQKLCEFFKLL